MTTKKPAPKTPEKIYTKAIQAREAEQHFQLYVRQELLKELKKAKGTLWRMIQSVDETAVAIERQVSNSSRSEQDQVWSLILDLSSNLPANLPIEGLARLGAQLKRAKKEEK